MVARAKSELDLGGLEMAYPKIVASASATAPASTPASFGQTTSGQLNPKSGDSIYVFIAYGSGILNLPTVSNVTDSSSNYYRKAGYKRNSSGSYVTMEIWYADNVPSNSTLQVKVTFTGNTVFAFYASDVAGGAASGSLDVSSSGQTGNATSSSDPTTSVGPNDLIIACQASVNTPPGVISSGGGFTIGPPELASGSSTSDFLLDVFKSGPSEPNDFNASLSWTNTANYAALTICIRSAVAYSGVPGRQALTVSAAGVALASSPILNAGADFGPDTPGTSTSGIQEAMNAASATGRSKVSLLPGVYNINKNIVWPTGWSGILEGSGSGMYNSNGVGANESTATLIQTGPSFTSSTPDLLDLGTQDVYNITIRDLYFYYGLTGATTGTSVVNLKQTTDGRHSIRVERCDFDSGSTTTDGFRSLIMDNNQGSILDQVNCWSPVNANKHQFGLQWTTLGGGVKVIGGTYDGMILNPQVAELFAVTTNHKIEVPGGSARPIIHLFGCYKNKETINPSEVILNNSGGPVTIIVVGGWYAAGAVSQVFFNATAAGSYCVLIIGGAHLHGFNSPLNPNPLLGGSALNQLYIFAPLDLVLSATANAAATSATGVGLPRLLGFDNRTDVTSSDGANIAIAVVEADTSLVRVTVSVTTDSAAVSTNFQYTIFWTDEDSVGQSVSVSGSLVAASQTMSNSTLAHVNGSSTIYVRLASLTGTSPKVDLAASVEILQ
jgi:hypothetical protein